MERREKSDQKKIYHCVLNRKTINVKKGIYKRMNMEKEEMEKSRRGVTRKKRAKGSISSKG